jgi:hypothetical protein
MDQPAAEPADIIGMACRYASAPNLQAFWDLLVSGQDGVIDYTPGRTPELDRFYSVAGSDLGARSRRCGFIENIDKFDADFFRISAGSPLSCPISAFGGADDPQTSQASLEGWRVETTGTFEICIFPGGHFYLESQRIAVLARLSAMLAQIFGIATNREPAK